MLIGKYIFVIFLNLFVIRNFSTCPSIEMLKGYMAGTSPAGGAMVPGPPFEIGAPPFHVWPPPVAAYTQYCILKMWPPRLVFGLSFLVFGPLLLNPGDGPGTWSEKVWEHLS